MGAAVQEVSVAGVGALVPLLVMLWLVLGGREEVLQAGVVALECYYE